MKAPKKIPENRHTRVFLHTYIGTKRSILRSICYEDFFAITAFSVDIKMPITIVPTENFSKRLSHDKLNILKIVASIIITY